ncbi:MAG: glycosyltransferase family 4 protein [Phycisphaerae bacterium]|nr:glycosyltransferase family 4 protein [Phycisphaerae bacterium]
MPKAPAATLVAQNGLSQDSRSTLIDSNPASGPITVCHPVWRLGRGGLELQLIHAVNGLLEDRFRHVVVVLDWSDENEALVQRIDPCVTIVRQSAALKSRNWSRVLAGILAEQSVDVVHVRGMSLLLDSLMAVELYGEARIACSFHGFQTGIGEFQGVRRKVYREALLRCDDRWAVGCTAARAIANELNLPADAFGVVRNGVDTERFAPAIDRIAVRRDLGLPVDKAVVLCLGNLKPIKGQSILLEAIGRMGAVAEQACFVFVGADGMGGLLSRWANERLEDIDIRFVGEADDPVSWYQAADLFVQPSISEGLSNSLLEAMSCGLAVAASNAGGNSEVVEDGRTGMLVPAGDPASLALAVSHLVARPAVGIEMARASRERVIRDFAMQSMVTQLADRYIALADQTEASSEDPDVGETANAPRRFASAGR